MVANAPLIMIMIMIMIMKRGCGGKTRAKRPPHSHCARDRKIQVLSLFLHIFHKFIYASTLLITKALKPLLRI